MAMQRGKDKPAPYAIIYVSLLGNQKDFVTNFADSLGKFYITLPDHQGSHELFISANHSDGYDLELLIEQDFCGEPLQLPSYPLPYQPGNLSWINDLSINAQINQQYGSLSSDGIELETQPAQFFYGSPAAVVRFDDFIELPTLEEYITEVTPKVTVRRTDRRKAFRILGEHPDLNFYDPLTMVDGVAIFDSEAILALSPRVIDRFEIVDAPYIMGNVTFGGILNIITGDGNLGSIDLPASGLLVDYDLYHEEPSVWDFHPQEDLRRPDLRNTLFWEPRLVLQPGEERHISFITDDVKGEYLIIIRGFDKAGGCVKSVVPFSVE
jgi:hypothetical protein